MTWSEYVTRLVGEQQKNVAAIKAGTSGPTIGRWMSGELQASADKAIQLARAYGDSPLNALIALGLITESEAKARPRSHPDFSQLSNDELLRLVRGRMREPGEQVDDPFGDALDALPPDSDDPLGPTLKAVDRAARKDDQ